MTFWCVRESMGSVMINTVDLVSVWKASNGRNQITGGEEVENGSILCKSHALFNSAWRT